MGIVGLINIQNWVKEQGPGGESQAKKEDLIGPTVFKYLSERSPASLDKGLTIPT